MYKACGAEGIVVTHAADQRAEVLGKTLAEIGEERGCDPFVATMDLLEETDLDVTMIDHYATEEAVRTIFRHPMHLVGSDGIFGDRPHPVSTVRRPVCWEVRPEGAVDPRRRSRGAADCPGGRSHRPGGSRTDQIGFARRHRAARPARFIDTATYDDPKRIPEGISKVFVAGRTVWVEGAPTGMLPGDVLREPLSTR